MGWARRTSRPIIGLSSRERVFELNDYSKGMDSYVSNDKFPVDNGGTNFWRKAQDARITTLGEYETRKGFDYHSDAAGETEDQAITSTDGADTKAFSTTTRLAQVFTAGASAPLTKVDLNLSNANGATGTIIVEIWTDDDGAPSTQLTRSSISSADLDSTAAYETVRFAFAPALTSSSDYWIVVYVQATGSGSYGWTSTTSATTALASSDSGNTWSATEFALNFKEYYATEDGAIGLFRARKSDGTKVTLQAHATTLYKVDDVTGALTSIKTGLSANATHYRFAQVNDIVYYVNEYDGFRKWDFTTESQVNSTNYVNICEHKGLLFLQDATDKNKWVFSNFADYETFTSTDFIYVPSPKTGDPSVAVASLNGYLMIWTRKCKYILTGDDNATFRLDVAPDKKGTYSQETIATDDNYAYFLSDDGMYQSNGTEPKLLSEGAYEAVKNISNKENACVVVNKGRLYLWYTGAGASENNSCYVWNLAYSGRTDVIESHDTDAYVSRAVSSPFDEEQLLVASSKVGQVYWQEKDSNDYNNLGGDINFLLETHYFTFDTPAAKHEVRDWKPRFEAQSGNYRISCEYAYDRRDNWTLQEAKNVQGSGSLWGAATTLWGSFLWGTTAEVQADLYIPGEYRRVAVRYRHYAARQPHGFLGHTLRVQSRRMR